MNPEELYEEIVMDHASRPRNHGAMEDATAKTDAENPLCGDELTLYLKTSGDAMRVEKTGFVAQACAICTASASLLTTKIRNVDTEEAAEISRAFQKMMTGGGDDGVPLALQALKGVARFPMRIKCATLAWHALDHAISKAREGGGTDRISVEE